MHGYIYICTYANVCTYTYMYIYMHMHTCIYISAQLVHARLCNGAAASLPWKVLRIYLESCANIEQAVVSAHPPAPSSSRQPSCWPVARHVRLRNPIKSTLAHDAVAAVVLHKHHLIIRVGAGLIEFVYGSHSRLAADLTLDKNLFSLPFSRLRQGRSRDASASGRTGHAVLLQEAISSNCHDARVVQGWADCCLHCSQVCTRMLSRL
jgi:hypothetical protein